MKKRIFAVLFIVLMVVMGGASIAYFIKTHRTETVSDETEQVSVKVNTSQISLGILDAINYAKEGINVYACAENPLSTPFLRISRCFNEVVQDDIILTGESVLLRLSNGYYTPPFPYSRPEKSWNSLKDFTDWLQLKDTKFFHLIISDKGDDSFGTLPTGAPRGYARMAEEYMAFLDENGIDYLEAKPKLLAQNNDFYHWFYKTDHRINVQAGLLLAEESAKKLKSLGVEADTVIVKKDKFTSAVYPNSFIGSLGSRLGPNHKDDLEIYYPIGETHLCVQIPSRGIVNDGSFDQTLVRKQYLSPGKSSLSAFWSVDQLVSIDNVNSHNETKVLAIGLCKMNVICPYLALAVRHLDMIDPRTFNGNIRKFIEQTNPDAVIFCIDVPWEGGEEAWKLQ